MSQSKHSLLGSWQALSPPLLKETRSWSKLGKGKKKGKSSC